MYSKGYTNESGRFKKAMICGQNLNLRYEIVLMIAETKLKLHDIRDIVVKKARRKD